jgi:16S rRNA processing protein RimM
MSTSSSSTDPPLLLEVGRVGRPHGLSGTVTVHLSTDRTERLRPGSELHSEAGVLRVASSHWDGTRWLVSFAGVSDRNAAEGLRGMVLRAEPIDDPGTLWVHELIGCEVHDHGGVLRGRVIEVQANPASDLLVLDTGHLVPLRFVTDGPVSGVVRVEVPDGLWDL